MRSMIYHFYQIVKSSLNVRRKERQRGSQSFRGRLWLFRLRYVNDKWPCHVISFSRRGQESKWREQARKIQRNLFTVDTNSVYLLRAHVPPVYPRVYRASRFVGRLDSTRKISCTRELRIRQQRINGSAGSEIFNVLNNVTRLTFSNDTFFFRRV